MLDDAAPGFPPHAVETLPWVSSTGRRAEIAEYEATIPPFLAGVRPGVSAATAELARQAMVTVAVLERSFSAELTILEPFLLRTEAVASSRIEEELTTVDQLARAEYGIKAPRTARTVKAAIDGLSLLVEESQESVRLETILAAHRRLLAEDPQDRWEAGTVRTVQNWIGGSNRTPRAALHVPPRPERVPELLGDLMTFIGRRDVDPVVQAAVAHAQFESIHPFVDGNGRIGRSLINAVWRARGATRSVAVPIASAIVADREEYFGLLDGYRAGDAEAFTAYLARCTIRASGAAVVSAERLLALPEEWRQRVGARRGSTAETLVGLLLRHPVVDAADVVRLTGSSPARAYVAVEQLQMAGVLRPITESRRHRVWAAGDVLDEADEMVDRLRVP